MTGELLKIGLRNRTVYSCNDVTDFLQPLLDEFLAGYPRISLLLWGDSGFATLDLYKQCETNGTSYAIRLKENNSLRKLASDMEDHLFELTNSFAAAVYIKMSSMKYWKSSYTLKHRKISKTD